MRLVHLGFGAGHVQQVLDALDALDAARLLLQVLDQLGPFDLAAEDDDAVLGVHVDLALGHVRVAEDLRLDLVGERGVVQIVGLLGCSPSGPLASAWTSPAALAAGRTRARGREPCARRPRPTAGSKKYVSAAPRPASVISLRMWLTPLSFVVSLSAYPRLRGRQT